MSGDNDSSPDMDLDAIFGKKKLPGMDEGDDGPSDDEVTKAKSDAFDSFWDAMHSKDKEKARKAWATMHGDDDDEGEDDSEPSTPAEQ